MRDTQCPACGASLVKYVEAGWRASLPTGDAGEPKCPRHGIYLCVSCWRGATLPQGTDALDDKQIYAIAKRIKMPKIFWDTQNFREWLGKFHAAASTEGAERG